MRQTNNIIEVVKDLTNVTHRPVHVTVQKDVT
jgi:hypothetical protein